LVVGKGEGSRDRAICREADAELRTAVLEPAVYIHHSAGAGQLHCNVVSQHIGESFSEQVVTRNATALVIRLMPRQPTSLMVWLAEGGTSSGRGLLLKPLLSQMMTPAQCHFRLPAGGHHGRA